MSAASPAASAQSQRASTQRKKPTRGVPSPVVEFTAAAHEHDEPMFDVSTPMTAAVQTIAGSPFDVPAYGFMRHIILEVLATGGVASVTVAAAADAPWSAINEVALLDVNGAPIFGPFTGYQLFLANLFGGYAYRQDPRLDADFLDTVVGASASGNFTFSLRIPVEILSNNGLGALANQNSAAAYKVRVRIGASTDVYTTAPNTTLPTVRVRATLEAWSQPNPTDLLGRPQAMQPPRHGTTQYWSVQTSGVNSGTQGPVRISRVGNLIRTLILVNRLSATGARDTASFPDPFQINWDARLLTNEWRNIRRKYMTERNELIVGGLPAGVFVFDYSHDVLGHNGNGTPELWLPTVQATRFEFTGTWTANVNLERLVNDVAPVEIIPADRYEEFSQTGFTPEVGVPVR